MGEAAKDDDAMIVTMTRGDLRAELRAATRALLVELLGDKGNKVLPLDEHRQKYCSIEDVATHFKVSTGTVRNWIKRGCPFLQRDKIFRFELDKVEAWSREGNGG